MRNLFETNAAKLRALHDAIHETWLHRNADEMSHKAWKLACHDFHTSFDSLAFPGGLGRAMSLLIKNNPDIIEQVVCFLEADPFFFRSGYLKADMIKHLRSSPLNEDQRKRLQKVILARIYEKARREFRWYCHLAKAVTDSEFERQITELVAESTPELISRQARWVLDRIKSAQ